MSSLKLRHSVRALVLDDGDRVLLCSFAVPVPAGTVVWAAPGGGTGRRETPLAALRRELREEAGLAVGAGPPHVWHQRVVAPGHAASDDGVVNDYFPVRTASFTPCGALSREELAAENVDGFRWWRLWDVAGYRGSGLFPHATSPRRWQR